MQRRTRQRQTIEAVLREAERPLNPNDVLERARARLSRLGIATVYRTLNALTRQGWLTVVELPGEPTRYELAAKRHHHHFRCEDCGLVFDIPGCAPELERNVPAGFHVHGHEVFLFGRCRACAA